MKWKGHMNSVYVQIDTGIFTRGGRLWYSGTEQRQKFIVVQGIMFDPYIFGVDVLGLKTL